MKVSLSNLSSMGPHLQQFLQLDVPAVQVQRGPPHSDGLQSQAKQRKGSTQGHVQPIGDSDFPFLTTPNGMSSFPGISTFAMSPPEFAAGLMQWQQGALLAAALQRRAALQACGSPEAWALLQNPQVAAAMAAAHVAGIGPVQAASKLPVVSSLGAARGACEGKKEVRAAAAEPQGPRMSRQRQCRPAPAAVDQGGRSASTATVRQGSWFARVDLESVDPTTRAAGFASALPDVLTLACDAEEHVPLLRFFEVCSVDERRALAGRLQGSVLRLSQDKYGCWAVQRAVETLPHVDQVRLALELRGHVKECVQHMHGNFVIQKCIEQLPQNALTFIAEELEDEGELLASHMYGCRAIQRLFEYCSPSQVGGIQRRILGCIAMLAQDAYGNNVVRHLLQNAGEKEKRHIITVMRSNILDFATNKSSSLVLEKCLEVATYGEHAAALEGDRAALVRALLGSGRADTRGAPLELIMLDKFGNYLVQRTIECSKGEEREILRQRLWAAEPKLRSSVNGKHILAAMRRKLNQHTKAHGRAGGHGNNEQH